MTDAPPPEAFPLQSTTKIRYSDADRQGHVNNAVFVTLMEFGRAEALLDPEAPVIEGGVSFVVARLELDYRAEMHWPGEVLIGTRVLSIGRSSFRLEHALYQDGACTALGVVVCVLMDNTTRRSTPLPTSTVAWLESKMG